MRVPNPKNNEAIYRLGEHGKRAGEWKPAAICFTIVRNTVPQYKGWKGAGKSRELHRDGAGKLSTSTTTDTSTSFARSYTTKRTIPEIWGSKTCRDSQ